ncbi:VOC family protein [Mycolicibacterium monacense]|uniref:VOC family protein n=1 Tax=Mycolicibacterium monacense TaxID=85693 RepID=UPI0007E97F55|nr:VOC family protein [Mycolicibacterium monacense]OBB56390.1 glyoxalase [Mycolicibacterium monacense]
MGLRFTDLCVDAADIHALGGWWAEVLGYAQQVTDDGDVILRPPSGAGPNILFLAVPDDKVVKNRLHVDLTPDDQQAEVDRLLALGARRVDIGQGEQSWVVLADPEGNEFCVLAAQS